MTTARQTYPIPDPTHNPPVAPLVTIEVRWGHASVTACPPGIEVQIVDWDDGAQGMGLTTVVHPANTDNRDLRQIDDEIAFLLQARAALVAGGAS